LAKRAGLRVQVTATTGLAACHINGTTLNAFAGIGTGEGSLEELLKSVCKGSNPERWRKCKVLIIDEASANQSVCYC
jgi:ATP-dependent DNA helicase PIF1